MFLSRNKKNIFEFFRIKSCESFINNSATECILSLIKRSISWTEITIVFQFSLNKIAWHLHQSANSKMCDILTYLLIMPQHNCLLLVISKQNRPKLLTAWYFLAKLTDPIYLLLGISKQKKQTPTTYCLEFLSKISRPQLPTAWNF